MDERQALVERVRQTQRGFLTIQQTADEVFARHTALSSFQLARQLLASDLFQARSLATFILGRLAAASPESLALLKRHVSRDTDWRVQEILAKAFDRYCADTGYRAALPVIEQWLSDTHPNVRRAVTEGLRIWTGRPYFQEHPQAAIRLLCALRCDESVYVRKSVGNALRDISKKHAALIREALARWELEDPRQSQVYKLAARRLT